MSPDQSPPAQTLHPQVHPETASKSNRAQQSRKVLNKYPPFETRGRSAITVKLLGRFLTNIKYNREIRGKKETDE